MGTDQWKLPAVPSALHTADQRVVVRFGRDSRAAVVDDSGLRWMDEPNRDGRDAVGDGRESRWTEEPNRDGRAAVVDDREPRSTGESNRDGDAAVGDDRESGCSEEPNRGTVPRQPASTWRGSARYQTERGQAALMDSCGNQWVIRAEGDGAGQPWVLPAQAAGPWQPVPIGTEAGDQGWDFLVADASGFVWAGGSHGLRRTDPRHPERGWQRVAVDATRLGAVTALTRAANGEALAGFAAGAVLELDLDADGTPIVTPLASAAGPVQGLQVDHLGRLWVASGRQLFRHAASPGAWQQSWEQRAHLPAGNHDLFAAELQGQMVTAGGLTSDYGFPARTHVFDQLLAYDATADQWATMARLPFPRCYGGIAWLEGRLWIVGGAANLEQPDNPDGPRLPLDEVLTFDPGSRAWNRGPSLSQPRLEPVVLAAAGRLWTAGGSGPEGTLDLVESLGPGESTWRREPPLPVPLGQAAGCVLDGQLYFVGAAGLFAFDPIARAWSEPLPAPPSRAQAAQVAAYRGEVWVMGGSLSRTTQRYRPQQRTWVPGPDLPTDQAWGAALDLGGRLIVAGGAHWSERHRIYVFDDRTWALRPAAV